MSRFGIPLRSRTSVSTRTPTPHAHMSRSQPAYAYHGAIAMGKHRWVSEERIDKFLSTLYWTDCNLRAAEELAAARSGVAHPLSTVSLKVASFAPEEPRPLNFAAGCEAVATRGALVTEGHSFGPLNSTHWFHVTVSMPPRGGGPPDRATTAGSRDVDEEQHLFLEWNSHSEGLVYLPDGSVVAGLTGEERDRIPLATLQSTADAADLPSGSGAKRPRADAASLQCYIEVACNERTGDGLNDMIAAPNYAKMFSLSRARVVSIHPRLHALRHDLEVILALCREEGVPKALSDSALCAGNDAVNSFVFGDEATWAAAAAITAAFFDKHRRTHDQPPALCIHAVGHCHIDTAWLWRYRESRRKVVRSWASQLAIHESLHNGGSLLRSSDRRGPPPPFAFVASQAVQFQWLLEDHPAVFARIQRAASEGAPRAWFQPVGATWVEMDGNLPGAESMLRQFYYGQIFFEQHFGSLCDTFWLPDTFGYAAQLPQICQHFGCRYFLSQKLSWNLLNKPRHTTFWWRAIDGRSRVLAHFPPTDSYNCDVSVAELLRNETNHKDLGRTRDTLMLFGHGDGGGGPTEAMVERMKRLGNLAALSSGVDGMHTGRVSGPTQFFQRVAAGEAETPRLATHVGELYFEMHRGTFTTQRRLKLLDRVAERLVLRAEALSVLAFVGSSTPYPAMDLEGIWKMILLNQFHDVLPGSCITDVVDDACAIYQVAIARAVRLCDAAIAALAASPATTSSARSEVNMTPHRSPSGCPAWAIQSHARDDVVPAPTSSSSCSSALLVATVDPDGDRPVRVRVCGQHYDVVFGERGVIEQLRYDRRGSEPLGGDMVDHDHTGEAWRGLNRLELFDDVPLYWDAWDLEIFHSEKPAVSQYESSVRCPTRIVSFSEDICELVSGPFVLGTRHISDSRPATSATVHITCRADSACIECHLTVDWAETHKVLKLVNRTSLRSALHAEYGTQFGTIERPAHANTSHDEAKFEVCGHGFVDLSEPGGQGIAVVNGSGLHGMSARDGTVTVSLLRGSVKPDPRADHGRHRIRYGFVPHAEPWRLQRTGLLAEVNRLEAAAADDVVGDVQQLMSRDEQALCGSLSAVAHLRVLTGGVSLAGEQTVDSGDILPSPPCFPPPLVYRALIATSYANVLVTAVRFGRNPPRGAPSSGGSSVVIIVHLHESVGRGAVHTTLAFPFLAPPSRARVAAVSQCDGLERPIPTAPLPLQVEGGDDGIPRVRLTLQSFEIIFLRLELTF